MSTPRSSYASNTGHRLSEREQEVLRLVVQSFIETAGPVGSRYLARRYALGLSPASIRNTMSDLEELGYLGHPYTSAGRMPTERGYRAFVDELMASPELSQAERQALRGQLDQLVGDVQELLRESSRLLGRMSNLLGVVLSPKLAQGMLEHLALVPLTASRVMLVLSVHGGFVRTLVFEVETQAKHTDLDRVAALLNERLAGLTLDEIRRTYADRLRDTGPDRTGLLRLIGFEAPSVFSEPPEGRLRLSGTQHLIAQPEFQEVGNVRHLIGLIEDEGYVVHLLEEQRPGDTDDVGRAVVSIGSEHSDEKVENYSIVTARYQIGATSGTLGVIGPTRMDYEHVVALVENMAQLLSQSGRPGS